jgi:hypothetical protein
LADLDKMMKGSSAFNALSCSIVMVAVVVVVGVGMEVSGGGWNCVNASTNAAVLLLSIRHLRYHGGSWGGMLVSNPTGMAGRAVPYSEPGGDTSIRSA